MFDVPHTDSSDDSSPPAFHKFHNWRRLQKLKVACRLSAQCIALAPRWRQKLIQTEKAPRPFLHLTCPQPLPSQPDTSRQPPQSQSHAPPQSPAPSKLRSCIHHRQSRRAHPSRGSPRSVALFRAASPPCGPESRAIPPSPPKPLPQSDRLPSSNRRLPLASNPFLEFRRQTLPRSIASPWHQESWCGSRCSNRWLRPKTI